MVFLRLLGILRRLPIRNVRERSDDIAVNRHCANSTTELDSFGGLRRWFDAGNGLTKPSHNDRFARFANAFEDRQASGFEFRNCDLFHGWYRNQNSAIAEHSQTIV